MSHRSRVSILLFATVAACEPLASPRTGPAGGALPLGSPLPLLTARQQHGFRQGSALFQTSFTPATGLGPLFNASSCAECHEAPVVGGVGDEVETHATAYHDGVCDDLGRIGGPVIQDSTTPALHAVLGLERSRCRRRPPRWAGGPRQACWGSGCWTPSQSQCWRRWPTPTTATVTAFPDAPTAWRMAASAASAGRHRSPRCTSSRAAPSSTRWGSRARRSRASRRSATPPFPRGSIPPPTPSSVRRASTPRTPSSSSSPHHRQR